MINQNEQQVRIGGNSLAISGDKTDNWYIGWSPDEDAHSAEGSWEEWVQLARAILDENNKR